MSSLTPDIEQQVKEKKLKLRAAKIPGFFIPGSQNEWNKLARSSKYHNIHKLDQRNDGIRVQYNGHSVCIISCGLQTPDKRRRDVSNSEEFKRFASVMDANIPIETLGETDENWPGSWVSVKSFQERIVSPESKKTREENEVTLVAAKDVLSKFSQGSGGGVSSFGGGEQAPGHEPRVPSGRGTAYRFSEWPSTPATSKPDFPDADDESIVNTYAIFLLEQSSRLLKHFLANWTMDRIKLEAWFNFDRYSAYTDGGLQPRGGALIQASVEVKKGIRMPDIDAITKQETSQVVAMIKKGCPAIFNEHWLVVSLDRHEAYLNFSSCPDAYMRYIRNGEASPKSFLTTQPLGPWDIGNVNNIQHFVRILVALTLKANLAVAEAICKEEQELEGAEQPQRKRQRRVEKAN